MVQDKNKCISRDRACCYKFTSGYPSCLPQNCKCLTPPNGGDWCPPAPNFDYPPCEEHDSPPSTSFTPNPPYTPPPSTPYHETPPANYALTPPLPTTPTNGVGNNQDHNNIITFIFANYMLVVMIGTLVVSFVLILVLVHYCIAGTRYYTYTSSFDGRNNRSELRRRRARQSLQTSGSFRSFFYSWPPSGFHARPRGLDNSLICLIPIYTYEGSEGTPVGSGTECAVCLGAFLHGDKLRLLPKCTHSFHVECIDEWLRSRTTCPLCRTNVVNFNYANAAMAAFASAQQSSNPTEPIPTSSNTAHHQSLSSSNSQAPQNLPESAYPHEPVAELKRSFSDGLLTTKNASVARTSAMSFDAASSTSFIGMEITKGKEAIKCPDNLPIAKNNILSSMKRSWSGSSIFSFKRKNTVAPTSTSHSHSHERPPI